MFGRRDIEERQKGDAGPQWRHVRQEPNGGFFWESLAKRQRRCKLAEESGAGE
jgi:hypothetical protein